MEKKPRFGSSTKAHESFSTLAFSDVPACRNVCGERLRTLPGKPPGFRPLSASALPPRKRRAGKPLRGLYSCCEKVWKRRGKRTVGNENVSCPSVATPKLAGGEVEGRRGQGAATRRERRGGSGAVFIGELKKGGLVHSRSALPSNRARCDRRPTTGKIIHSRIGREKTRIDGLFWGGWFWGLPLQQTAQTVIVEVFVFAKLPRCTRESIIQLDTGLINFAVLWSLFPPRVHHCR